MYAQKSDNLVVFFILMIRAPSVEGQLNVAHKPQSLHPSTGLLTVSGELLKGHIRSPRQEPDRLSELNEGGGSCAVATVGRTVACSSLFPRDDKKSAHDMGAVLIQ